MNVNQDLLGKTITGVIASGGKENSPREIWVLQFADGSHVEFVSPGARKALRGAASQGRSRNRHSTGKAGLEPAENVSDHRAGRPSGRPMRLADSRSMRYQRDPEESVQLTLNVA